ncbi:hypothetical protein KC660_00650 [Candidatus Dojkabacteria bacterium]|uniref:DNA-binding transcriptional regulator n=1 Tax=Candidatus Dojkabacteria bacterium TaxID=2099670 RepID=A0A955RI11_9BACT|nr:hypothetical protein [Candidatus Dojkabacteria bacterium]
MANWLNENSKDLFTTIANLNDLEEVANFMRDLLTIKEIDTLSSRWRAARLLQQGVPYTEIEKQTGLSSATIARVNQYREYGMGGYKKALEESEKHD